MAKKKVAKKVAAKKPITQKPLPKELKKALYSRRGR